MPYNELTVDRSWTDSG